LDFLVVMAVLSCKIWYNYSTICWEIDNFYKIKENIENYSLTFFELKMILMKNKLINNLKKESLETKNSFLINKDQSAGNFKKESSETKSIIPINKFNNDQFGYWLAGLIDGSLLVSKAEYVSCEITLHESEIEALYYIKSKLLLGSVSKRSNAKAYRWRLHNKLGMIKLINIINGKLIHPKKHEQLIKVCKVLGIEPILTHDISIDNAWLTGLIDAEGSFNCNSLNNQLSISIAQKDKNFLDNIKFLKLVMFMKIIIEKGINIMLQVYLI